jgi:hypothetical protein
LLLRFPDADADETDGPHSTAAWAPTLFEDSPTLVGRAPVDGRSTPEAKIGLFRSLFAGRDDVYAAHWANECSGKSGWSPAVVGGPANARRRFVSSHAPFTLRAPVCEPRLISADHDAGWIPQLDHRTRRHLDPEQQRSNPTEQARYGCDARSGP